MCTEYILWKNCTGKCKFCLQQEMCDTKSYLTEEEMLESIQLIEEHIRISVKHGEDILLVGGEILFPYYISVRDRLVELFDFVAKKIKRGEIRYLYLNSNLCFVDTDRYLLDKLLTLFVEYKLEDNLRFTTSFDVYGRFRTVAEVHAVLGNLKYIKENYPSIKVVVNTIMTKQLIDSVLWSQIDPISGIYDTEKLLNTYGVHYINFLPYIKSTINREMDVSFAEISKFLSTIDGLYPGYLKHYIEELDLTQDRKLFEYDKNSKALVGITSDFSPCGHNVNFTHVCEDVKCFICELKHLFF